MKILLLVLILSFLFVLFGGCASSKRVPTEKDIQNKEQSDSVRLVIVTEYVKDTVLVTIPKQTAQRESRDSVSTLENDYASSEARIRPDGSLYHDLRTKPQQKPVEIRKPVERRDSIAYRTSTKTQTVTEIKEVERDLTWWQKTCIYGFYAAIIFLVITYTKKKIKPLIDGIRKK